MGKYEDIIALPHHQSETRAHMPLRDRAAQFAPFAALTGFGAAVDETARRTDTRVELSETRKEELNAVLLAAMECSQPLVELTWFVDDLRKDGGAYVTRTGNLEKIDPYTRTILLTDGTVIPINDLFEMEILDNGI